MKQDSQAQAILRRHGGDLSAAAALFPAAPRPWLDLSTGINPVSYPVGRISASAWRRLPDSAALAGLMESAARFYGVPDPDMIAAGPGTQAIIHALPDILPARRVGLLGPSYGGHAQGWAGRCARFTERADLAALRADDVGIIVNPNNPDGRLRGLDELRDTARALALKNGALIVDEAFIEAAPGAVSLAPEAAACGALVLRSFGKIFGLAGLRLGFAVTTPARAAALRARLGPWAVSGAAIEIACRAFADKAWLAKTQARLARDAARLDAMLEAAGFTEISGTSLFRYARHTDAPDWFTRLGARGILTRPFADSPGRLRLGLPGDAAGWARLAAALGD